MTARDFYLFDYFPWLDTGSTPVASTKRERRHREMMEEYERKDLEKLRELLSKRGEVYTVTSVSKSGMTRWIKLFIVADDCKLWDITYLVAKILDKKLDKSGRGIKIVGIGFSAPQEVIFRLGQELFGEDCLKYKEIG